MNEKARRKNMPVTGYQKKILVVEDDRSNRGITRFVLESSGYSVDMVETATRALGKIRNTHYDLLIFSSSLNDRMIIQLLQTIKNTEKYADIPVLFLLSPRTFETLNHEKQRVVETADAYLTKPIQARTFIAKVHELLSDIDDEKKSDSNETAAVPGRRSWIPWHRKAIPGKTSPGNRGEHHNEKTDTQNN